jgi:hypothetical protein
MQRLLRILVRSVFAVVMAGCGGKEFVPVEGRVTLNGKPLPEVEVKFLPDNGKEGNTASAVTDADGRYKLESSRDKRSSTITGPHRVILIDLPAHPMYGMGAPANLTAPGKVPKESQGPKRPQPRRYPKIYEEPLKTPLRDVNVDREHRTFEFDLGAEKSATKGKS